MLERYFVRPETIDHVRSSWISEPIERYVTWLTEQEYRPRNVFRRVPILVRFGTFAASRGAVTWADLPAHVQHFTAQWVQERGAKLGPAARTKLAGEARVPVEQMLRLILPDFVGTRRPHASQPFLDSAPRFFSYLREERGLREASVYQYAFELRHFERYLRRLDLRALKDLSPVILTSYVVERAKVLSINALTGACVCVRVFVRYLHRENVIARDLSASIQSPQTYRLAGIPRSISWAEVTRVLGGVDRRSASGRRDYALLLLLVTYGLRAREIAALTLDDIDWRAERLRIPERKAGHSTAYPLSPIVGEALLAYIQHGRPRSSDRHVFLRVLAPFRPITHCVVSSQAAHYLRKAGVEAPRLGSHTLRHTCVQRLVDADFSLKAIGDYVGHRSPSSTEIYGKVAVEALREVALGLAEEVL